MPNMPEKHGRGYRVRWRNSLITEPAKRWQSKTVSGGTDTENKDGALALYVWLRKRGDAVMSNDPAIVQRAYLRDGEFVHPVIQTAPTFGALADEVLARKTHVSQATRDKFSQRLKHFADWLPLPVTEITDRTLADKASNLHARFAEFTARGALTCALEVIKYAVTEGHVEANADPRRHFVLGTAHRTKMIAALSLPEFRTLHACAVDQDTADMLALIAATGCRISEIHALKVRNVDHGSTKPSVLVCEAVKYSGKNVRTEGRPKFGKIRSIPVDPATAAMLARRCAGKAGGDHVFTNSKGEGWSYSAWRSSKWLPTLKAARAAGLTATEVTPHVLRHSFASWALADGVDIRTLSGLLGHADPGFTLRTYTHLVEAGTNRHLAALTQRSAALYGTPLHAVA